MAKVSFTKLGLKVNQDFEMIEFNGQMIEVKQYLPVNEKLELISNVINLAHDENNFSNPVKVSIYTTLEIMYAYTNINFTEKQKENVLKLYDGVVSSGLFDAIVENIPAEEWEDLQETVWHTISNIYNYKNSVMGVLETISTDYSNLNLDASEIQAKLSDPENLTLLKDVITKLG